MREYEAIKQEYADGIHKLNDDEYIGDNGLPYCKKCHTPKWYVYDEMACPVLCKCQEEAQARHEEAAAGKNCLTRLTTGKNYRCWVSVTKT